MPFQGAERRLRARYRVRVPFVVKSSTEQIRGTTRNISLLGISAYADHPLPAVQPVQCYLELPRISRPIIANGTVIRCESLSEPHPDGPYELGIFFKGFQKPGETTLARFLHQIERQEQAEIKVGYLALKKRLAQRRRRKQMEELRRRRRRQERLRRRRLRLARQKRLADQRKKRRQARRKAAKAGK